MLGELTAEQTAVTEKAGNRDFCEERKISFFNYFPELPENMAYSTLEIIF